MGYQTLNNLLNETTEHIVISSNIAGDLDIREESGFHFNKTRPDEERWRAVRIKPLATDQLEILYVEQTFYFLPRTGRRHIATATPTRLKLNWSGLNTHREIAIDHQFQPYRDSILEPVRCAADKLREAYFRTYGEELKQAPLERLIYSQAVATLPGT